MQVRRYSSEDKLACLEIFSSNIPTFFAENELNEFDVFLDSDSASYLVIENEGKIYGCGGYYIRDGVGRLCWGMVRKGSHRNGFGSSLLLARLDKLFNEHGIDIVAINTSQHSSGFFEHFGFRTETITKNGLAEGLHEYKMILTKEMHLKCNRQSKDIFL